MPSGTSRRTASSLARAVALLVAVGLVAGGAAIPSAGAGEFTADDVYVESKNGKLDSLTVSPAGTVTYEGFERRPTETTVAVQVRVDGDWETVASRSVEVTDLTGSFSYGFSTIDLLQSSSLTADVFAASPHEPTSTPVTVRVQVAFADVGADGADLTVAARDTFTVTVEHAGGPPDGGGGPPSGGGGPPECGGSPDQRPPECDG